MFQKLHSQEFVAQIRYRRSTLRMLFHLRRIHQIGLVDFRDYLQFTTLPASGVEGPFSVYQRGKRVVWCILHNLTRSCCSCIPHLTVLYTPHSKYCGDIKSDGVNLVVPYHSLGERYPPGTWEKPDQLKLQVAVFTTVVSAVSRVSVCDRQLILQIFGGLVLGCIETKVCKQN